MEDTVTNVDRVITAIRNANLQHPDEELLECFVHDSIDPGRTARYVLQSRSIGRDALDLTLLLSDWKELIGTFTHELPFHQKLDRVFIADIWRRDGGKCCITGLKNSFSDPLVVAPILPIINPIRKSLHEMLEAFLGSEGQQWIPMNEAASLDAHRKYWLVRKSAATALSQGYYRFTFLKGSEYHVTTACIGGPAWPPILEKTPVLQPRQFATCSASGMGTPDVYSLQILSRFAKPVRWSCIDRKIARKRSQPHSQLPVFSLWRLFPERITMTSTIGWHMVPASLRIQVYHCLAFMGARVYGQSCSLKVQQLPFGMYLKTSDVKWHESLANEYETLRLVRRYTRIPVPRPLDLVSYMGESYLLTSQVPGLRLGWCIDTLSDDEVGMLVHDLQGYIGELRAIPKEVAPDYAITNALGKPCFDYRLNAALDYDEDRGDFVGPFADEEQFNETLQCGALPGVTHRSGHEIVFTHGDLNMRNILVRNGRLSGIVDWETSGWYPGFWDYTKAHYITKLHRRWLRIVDKIFQQYGGYEDELATERQLWDYCF